MNKHAITEFPGANSMRRSAPTVGFPVGTRIRTEHGERAVETLKSGDRVVTRHGKLVDVLGVDLRSTNEAQSPIRISKDALGGGLPRRDVVLAADQSVLLADPLLEQLFDCTTALVSARDLVGLCGVEPVNDIETSVMVHVECGAPEVLFCSGLSCISQTDDAIYDRAPKLAPEMVKTYTDQL